MPGKWLVRFGVRFLGDAHGIISARKLEFLARSTLTG